MAATIGLNASGPAVKQIQQMLNKAGVAKLPVSGEFDAKTQDAVKAFQKQQKVKPTGEVDGSLLKVMLEYQKMVAKEAAQDKKLAGAKLSEKQKQLAKTLRGRTDQLKKMRDQAAQSRAASDAIDKFIQQWQKTLAPIGDDAQLANVNLQNVMQQQQQAMQMMSNVSKKLHETTKSIISNMRA